MPTTSPIQGAYAARSTPKISPIWTALGILVAFVAGLVAGSSASPEEPDGGRLATMPAELQQKLREAELENARLRTELEKETVPSEASADLEDDPFDEESDLEGENAELISRVAALEKEVDRYRQALEKSVEELNRIQAERRTSAPSTPPRRAGSGVDKNAFVFAREPFFIVVSTGRMDVEGSVHNANRESVSGYLYLTVYEGSAEIASERIPLNLKGREVREYSTTISDGMIRQDGRYDVRAEWDSR